MACGWRIGCRGASLEIAFGIFLLLVSARFIATLIYELR